MARKLPLYVVREKSRHGKVKFFYRVGKGERIRLAADAGAATHELMAQYGWSSVKQAELYTRGADRIKLGIKSSRRVADRIESTLPTAMPSGAGRTENKPTKTKR